ncbi:MAG: carboxypeptidase regulatory-like domain-containing protein [Ignavibacteriae bacterium]|nr:carboxypeptidase regulatory-like domain-containing protein [Ignavibacteriota bacterium]
MNRYILNALLAIVIITVIGCEGEEGKRGIPAPVLRGSITGMVTTAIKDDIKGIEVKIAETSQTVLTDSIGNWTINDVKAGIYTLEFSKAGYGISKIQNYSFVGGGVSRVTSLITLTKLPTYTATHIDLIEAPTDDLGQFSCIVNFTPEAPRSEVRYFRVYFSKNRNYVPTSGDFFYTTTFTGFQANPYTDITLRVKGIVPNLKTKNSLSSMSPFVKGDSVYVVVCASASSGSTPLTTSGFNDNLNFGQYVYTDITSPTNTVSFVLP